jgi:hypothetical protein
MDRIVQVAPSDADRPRWECRGEEGELPFGRSHRQDAFDVGREPLVKHLISLIEHGVAEMLQVQIALSEMVQHPTWRADNDLRPGEQRLALRPKRAAANELCDPQAASAVECGEDVAHLPSKLARRYQHQRLRLTLARVYPLNEG